MNGEFRLGPWLVQPRLNTIVLDGQSVRLEPKVMQVLVCLARGGGDVVEKEQLIRAVWPDTFVSDDALTRCISELRKTFEDDAREARVIQTIPKIGYRLVAPVEEVAHPAAAPTASPLKSATGADAAPIPASKLPSSRRGWVAVAAVLALLGAGVWLHRRYAHSAKETINSIAVLPFANGTPDAGIDYLSDGIALSVSNSLSRISNLKVISQTSTSYYRGQRIDPTSVGGQLGAQALVTGRMVRQGENLLVSVELIKARDNSHLWGAEYEYPAQEVMTLEEEIARDVIANLRIPPSATPTPPVKRPIANSEAYQLYLQGRYLWNRRTPESINKSIDYFQQAIAKDPQAALAYAGLADAYNLLSEYNSVLPREAFPKAEAAAHTALSLDDSLAEAHTSLGMVQCSYDWDFTAAEAEYRRAIALNPNYATAHHWYSIMLETLGRQEEAHTQAQRALEVDPLSLIIAHNLVNIDSKDKRFDEARKIAQKLLDLDPNFPLTYGTLMDLHLEEGNCPAALADAQKMQQIAPGTLDTLTALAYVHARCGDKEPALEVIRKLEGLAKSRYYAPSEIASLYATIGDKDPALTWLEKGLAARDEGVLHMRTAPVFDFMRQDPRFLKLMQEIKPLN